MNSYSCLAKHPEITSLYFAKQGKLCPTSIQLTVVIRFEESMLQRLIEIYLVIMYYQLCD